MMAWLVPGTRGYSDHSASCEVVKADLGRFVEEQKSMERTLTYLPFGGIGDQASGFLGAVVLAMLTERRLVVPWDSFWRTALEPAFETDRRPSLGEDNRRTPSWICDKARDRRMPLAQWLRRRQINGTTAWTNLYCGDHQLEDMMASNNGLKEYFTAGDERIRVGNVGHRLFDLWLQRLDLLPKGRLLGLDPTVRGTLCPCAFRALLRPTARASHIADAVAPIGNMIIGIHIRASRYLAKSAYKAENDDVFCQGPRHDVVNFSDVWEATHLLEKQLLEDQPGGDVRWLLVTDSLSLKEATTRVFGPTKVLTTPFIPSHPTGTTKCPLLTRPRQDVTPYEEVVAELVLLSRVDALIAGSSRFSSLAVFWCTTCRGIWFYQDCSHTACEPDTERRYATGLHTEGRQFLVGRHAVIEKLTRNQTFIPTFF